MTPTPSPTGDSERIVALDTLRGVAVLGILIMNIQSYSMPLANYMNPAASGPLVGPEWWAWLLGHLVADRKFLSLFSIMFGAGILLFADHAEARGESSSRLHYRRMFWLLLFGAIHAYGLWPGDILFSYAVCGMLVFPLRKMAPRNLLLAGLAAMAIGSALYLFLGLSMDHWPPGSVAALEASAWRPSHDLLMRQIHIYRSGWLAQMPLRAAQALTVETKYLLTYELWRAGGLMLVGMALFRWGVLTMKRSAAFYVRCAAAGLLAGIPLVLLGVHLNVKAAWSIRYSFFIGSQFNSWAGVAVALAYASLVMLAVQNRWLPWLTARLAATGRMAFTNYILQTILATTIFYGHGLGLYGSVSRVGQLGVVVAIWAVIMTISPWWLQRFRFGPLEWLWRALTYGSPPPFRRDHAAGPR